MSYHLRVLALALLVLLTVSECRLLDGCNEKGCSHKCLEKFGIPKCSCPDNMVLGPDKKTCSDAVQILLGMFRGVSLYSESSGDFRPIVSGQITALDYHYNNKLLFAASKPNNTINKYSLANTEKKPTPIMVHKSETMVTSLAVDWVQDQIFWICEQKSAIESSSLTGTNHKLIVQHNDTSGTTAGWHDLAVDPYVKKLFWLGKNGEISSWDLTEGKLSQVQLVGLQMTPEDITLDTNSRLMYLIGSQHKGGDKIVVKARYDGTAASQVLPVNQPGSQIYGLSVLGQNVYWESSNDGENLYKSEISSGGKKPSIVQIEELYQIVFDMKVYHEDVQRPLK